MLLIVLVGLGGYNSYITRSSLRGTRMKMLPLWSTKTGVPPSLKDVPYRITHLIDTSAIEAVNVRHIAVATEDLANQVKSMLSLSLIHI